LDSDLTGGLSGLWRYAAADSYILEVFSAIALGHSFVIIRHGRATNGAEHGSIETLEIVLLVQRRLIATGLWVRARLRWG
jgi:hypothetical protein